MHYDNKVFSLVDTGAGGLFVYKAHFESMMYKIFDYAGISDWYFDTTLNVVVTQCEYRLPSIFT